MVDSSQAEEGGGGKQRRDGETKQRKEEEVEHRREREYEQRREVAEEGVALLSTSYIYDLRFDVKIVRSPQQRTCVFQTSVLRIHPTFPHIKMNSSIQT